MECTHPIKVWKPIDNTEDKRVKFSINPGERKNYEEITIPCGKCTACKLNHAKEWGIRCAIETKYNPISYFLTLTYDDEKLFYTADQQAHPSLNKKHLQDFIKKLRKKYTVRYFACGEYGPKTGRPHYHVILWLDRAISDLKGVNSLISTESSKYLNSEQITQIWGKGNVTIAYNNYNTSNYVAKYTLKKQGINNTEYEDYGLNKPFLLMSRKPIIGWQIINEPTINFDKVIVSTWDERTGKHGKKECKVPRTILEKMNEDLKETIKYKRYIKGNLLKREQIRISGIRDRTEWLENQEDSLKSRIKRNKI